MELREAIFILKQHNKWRRGSNDTPMINPTSLREAIDVVLNQLEDKNLQSLPKEVEKKECNDDSYRTVLSYGVEQLKKE